MHLAVLLFATAFVSDIYYWYDCASEEHGMMAELAETLENIPDIKLKSREVQPVDDCLPLAVSLIKATAQKGGSILVFLPGN